MYQFNNLPTTPDIQIFNATAPVPVPYQIGQPALGGIIAYILLPGDPGYDANFQKGLVATVADLSASTPWGCYGTIIPGADGTAIGTGNQNTIDIMAGCAQRPIGASLCGDLVEGGFSDWYLPSIDELLKLWENRVAIGGFTVSSNTAYLSSSEFSDLAMRAVRFDTGNVQITAKLTNLWVRAVRSFSIAVSSLPSSQPQWQSWTKPNNATLINILCIGGGGGAGSGRLDSTAATARFGGGGGGSSPATSMFIPAFLIPDTLYVQVGLGGAGGAAQTVNATNGNNGSAGGASYVALYPNYIGTQVGNLLLSANGGGAGGGGTTTTGTGGIGASSTAVGSTSPSYLGLGQFTSAGSQTGGSSSATAAPSATSINSVTCGGAAGGGITTANAALAGGAITSTSSLIPYLITSLAGGIADGAAQTCIGNNGYAIKKPLMYIGGTGGGGTTGGRIGTGGNGAIGCGGGGGGAGTGTSSGAGGKGGDGIVIITSYIV